MAIYQDLVTEHGFAAKYASVMRFVRRLRGAKRPEPCGVILTEPGQEAQVDYGDGPMVRDAAYGQVPAHPALHPHARLQPQGGASAASGAPRRACGRSCTSSAFRRLGGAVRVVVLDNLREGVLKPDVYDPELNPLYRDVLAPLRRRRAAGAGARSESKGQGRVGDRPHPADAAARHALREL